MSINNMILWEKWRPKTIEDIILLPRIKNQISSGISQHYIFYGNCGTGKTSLARILIGRYSKNSPYLELNCSYDTSIDVLREKINDFCKFAPIMETESDIKYVFLDEFERVSMNFQDAFKSFIEKYNKNVRFIITTNHINKISKEIKSRIKMIDFDPQDLKEEKFLKNKIAEKIVKTILPSEGREVQKEFVISIINKSFPDLRNILVELQNYLESGEISDKNISLSNKIKMDLYSLIYESEVDYEKIYNFLISNFGPEKIHDLIKLLGRPFIDWSLSENKNVEKLFKCNYIIADYSPSLETSTDPIIIGLTIVGKFRDTLLS